MASYKREKYKPFYIKPKKKYVIKVPKTWLKNEDDIPFYNSSKWRKLSLAYKERHPICENDGCNEPSYYTDHIVPISEGGEKLYEDNLQALCVSCNAKKTAKQRNKTKN